MKTANLIDYTAEALHRRWMQHDAAGQCDEAVTLSYLIQYYLHGVMQVDWKSGEPFFSLTEYGKSVYSEAQPDEETCNDPIQLDLFSGASGDEN